MTKNQKHVKSTPKDFFLYLLSILTLYLVTANIISLLFNYINRKFPFSSEYFFNNYSIRWNLATIIVTLPVLMYTLLSLKKDSESNPIKNNLRIRKWLLGFTLFFAILILMFDIGTLLFYFLGGDLTVRFVLKTLVVLVIIGYVLYFYLHEMKIGWTLAQLKIRLTVIAIICLLILGKGFFLVGSPLRAQKQVMDNRRIADLREIQSQIISYWTHKQRLPENLDQLTNEIEGYKVPNDPETHRPYPYHNMSKYTFRICAEFKSNSNETYPVSDSNAQNWSWEHPAGFKCFIRTIDPDLYQQK